MFALVTASPSFASREAVRQGTPCEALRQGKPWEAAPCLSKRIICSRFYQHASPGVNISSLSNVRNDLYRYQQFQPLKVIEVAVNIISKIFFTNVLNFCGLSFNVWDQKQNLSWFEKFFT